MRCSVCKGKGEVKFEGKEYDCPECYGKGYYVESKPFRWHLHKHWYHDYWTVTRTEINQTDKQDLYKVMYWAECNGFPAEKVFTSKAKAIKEINRLNKAIEEEKLSETPAT
jgi:DnaJ-class molecular chaperone